MRKFFFLLFALIFSSCNTAQLKSGASKVFVFSGEPTKHCTVITSVKGSDSWGANHYENFRGARNNLMNEAYKVGGNAVSIDQHQASMVESDLYGTAYSCTTKAGLTPNTKVYLPNPETIRQANESIRQGSEQIGQGFSGARSQPSATQSLYQFCIMDNNGRTDCRYQTLSDCQSALKYSQALNPTCVKK